MTLLLVVLGKHPNGLSPEHETALVREALALGLWLGLTLATIF